MKKKEVDKWLFIGFITAILTIWYFIPGFFANCIFKLPIRWDVKTCWNEEFKNAYDKAIKDIVNMM